MAAARDFETLDSFAENIDDDDDDDSEGWNEVDMGSEIALSCLFCPQSFKTMAVALEHCRAAHGVDLMALKHKFSMDCYSYISFVNYVRRERVGPEDIVGCTTPKWMDSKYLEPALQDDPWLMFDFEGFDESRPVSPGAEGGGRGVKIENGLVTMDQETYSHLQATIHQLRTVIQEKNSSLAQAASDIELMKSYTQTMVKNMSDAEEGIEKKMGRLKVTPDHSYFNSYSHYGIHKTMLADKPRTISYRDAILNNAELVAGKVVLDVGCGTGILSMFSAQAGAAMAIGVDQSEIIYNAMDIIRENGLEGKIQLLKGRIEEVSLPVEKVDILISEWMGYFLLFEGMLDAVLAARDKYLKPGGLLLPNRCTMSLVGISDIESYQDNIGFWSDVYGFKMSCLKTDVLKEADVSLVKPESVITTPALVHSLDLNSPIVTTAFSTEFTLTSNRDCPLTAIVGYFDCFFDLPNPVILSTSPLAEKTHWAQTIFYLAEPIPVTAGGQLTGRMTCEKKPDDPRSLVIQLELNGKSSTYSLA